MTNFVLLVQVPFTDRDYQRNGISILAQHGIDITVLDVSNIAMPRLVTRPERLEFPDMRLIVVDGMDDLVRCEPILRAASLIISHVGSGFLTKDNLPVMRAICSAGPPTMMLNNNASPWWRAAPKILGSGGLLTDFVTRLRLLNPVATFLNRMPLRLFGVRPYDYVVYGGRKSVARRRLITSSTQIINAHSLDYDLYLGERNTVRDDDAPPYAVFLDQYFGFHPDVAMGGEQAEAAETFYPLLRRLMDRIEIECGLKTIIAAHPRADYSDKPGLFGDRQIIHGESPRLVRQSHLVITSYSIAVGFAVMFNKPLCLISTQALQDHPVIGWDLRRLCQELGMVPLNIDSDYALDNLGDFDPKRYEAYFENYVKIPSTPEIGLWEIVLKELMPLFKTNGTTESAILQLANRE